MSDLYWLMDEGMARLQPFFLNSHGKPRVDDRLVLSGIVFVDRSGLRWCDVTKDYGPAPCVLVSETILRLPATTNAGGMDDFDGVAVSAPLGSQQLTDPLAVDHQRQAEQSQRKEDDQCRRAVDRKTHGTGGCQQREAAGFPLQITTGHAARVCRLEK